MSRAASASAASMSSISTLATAGAAAFTRGRSPGEKAGSRPAPASCPFQTTANAPPQPARSSQRWISIERSVPVEGIAQAGGLIEMEGAQLLDECRYLRGQTRSRGRHLRRDDPVFLVEVRIFNPPVQTPPLQRVVHLAGAVRRDDDNGRFFRSNRAELGNRDLKIRQELEQVSFELFVRAIDFVDEEHRRARPRAVDCTQQPPAGQE